MGYHVAKIIQLSKEELRQPLLASALDVRLMCEVTHQTSPVTLTFNDGHQEKIYFRLYISVHHPLILSLPWLIKHNPHTGQREGF